MATEPAPTARSGRWLRRGAAGVIGLALGWAILPPSLSALALSRNNGELAVRLHANAKALSEAGSQALLTKRYAEAQALGERSLDRSLFNVEALRTVGLGREGQNPEDPMAGGFMALAGQLGWRDTPTQLWYVRTATLLGEYEIAMQRADALLRVGAYVNETSSYLRMAATDQHALPFILMRLVEKPRWRTYLFRSGEIDAQQRNGLDNLVTALAQSSAPVTRDEIAPYLNSLVNDGEIARADRVKRIAFGDASSAWPKDGKFAEAAKLGLPDAGPLLPFEWKFVAPPGINTRFDPDGGLAIEMTARKRGKVAEQLIRLAPGSYRIATVIADREPNVDAILRWTLTCIPSRQPVTSAPAIASLSTKQTTLAMDITVPAEACDAQQLTLTAGSGSNARDKLLTLKQVSILPR